jgi:hypothetical protein
MDTRLIIVAAPLLIAASWALYNIGRLAIQQLQRLSR